ncbi:hypothetical protein HanLR1_Chr05g0192641 [Helianthus annuus]|nr:hypothetical protein HanLR1_Chr05g0192641 [Helianthus annuus]
MSSITPPADPTPSDSGKETVITNTTTVTVTTPTSEPTDALTTTTHASPPLVCLFRFAGDAAAGGLMGSVFGYANHILVKLPANMLCQGC